MRFVDFELEPSSVTSELAHLTTGLCCVTLNFQLERQNVQINVQ